MKYYDISERAHKLRPFNFIIGGRGIGKTYSTLLYLVNSGKPFLYLRNTATELELSCSDFGNPFKRLNADFGMDIIVKMRKDGHADIIRRDEDNTVIGYGAALSTFSSMRGVDLSDVQNVIHDEFITGKKLAFDQYAAFVNMYETINRNRELQGEQALRVICLSNAQTLTSAILLGMGLTSRFERMLATGKHETVTDLYYLELAQSEVSGGKSDTALYKLIRGSDIEREYIANVFANDDFGNIGIKPLREYVPLFAVDHMYIYRHKSNGSWYVSGARAVSVTVYNGKTSRGLLFRLYYKTVALLHAQRLIYFENFTLKQLFIDIFGLL